MEGLVVFSLVALPIALGLHWWLGRWLWSLSVPVLGFKAYLLLRLYVVDSVVEYAALGLIVGVVLGVPAVLFGALTGTLMGRSLRLEYREHSNKPFQPIARDDARSG